MSTPKDEEIKIRVPKVLKVAVKSYADGLLTSESAIAREALIEYLARRNISLQDSPTAPPPPPAAPPRKVSYRKPKNPPPDKLLKIMKDNPAKPK